MFITIGERINSSRPAIAKALEVKDDALIQKEARLQKEAGADMLDVNCASHAAFEIGDMQWLVEVVQKETSLPLSIDSPDPKAIEAGLRKHKGTALINSITLEKDRAESILPLVKQYKANVIVLLMGEKGMPATAQDRLQLAESALKLAEKHKIYPERLYIDPLVRPISSEPKQALEVLSSVNLIKSHFKVKLICGLSNVSYGLPERSLVNSVFLAMMQSAGLDAAILDPTNKKVKVLLKASAALLGRDNFCIEYIKSYRNGDLKL